MKQKVVPKQLISSQQNLRGQVNHDYQLNVEISDEETTHKTSDQLRTDSDSEPQSPPKKRYS